MPQSAWTARARSTLPNRCGDINYLNLKSATLWSSSKLLDTSSGPHVKVLSQVSCHLDTPLWRYPTLPVWKEICRKLLFYNLSIVWPIKILLITFCQEGPQMLSAKFRANWWNRLGEVRKSRFSTFCDVAKKNGGGNGRGLYHETQHSALNAWI